MKCAIRCVPSTLHKKLPKLAQKQGATELAAWQADATKAGKQLQAPVVVSRAETHNISPTVIAAALQAPVSQLPAFVGVDLGAAGYAIAKINAVLPTEDKPKELSRDGFNSI